MGEFLRKVVNESGSKGRSRMGLAPGWLLGRLTVSMHAQYLIYGFGIITTLAPPKPTIHAQTVSRSLTVTPYAGL